MLPRGLERCVAVPPIPMSSQAQRQVGQNFLIKHTEPGVQGSPQPHGDLTQVTAGAVSRDLGQQQSGPCVRIRAGLLVGSLIQEAATSQNYLLENFRLSVSKPVWPNLSIHTGTHGLERTMDIQRFSAMACLPAFTTANRWQPL